MEQAHVPPEPYICKYCGEGGLYWWPTYTSYRLGDKDMKLHKCPKRPDTNTLPD